MRLPVPNLRSALTDKLGKIVPPWNSWFQQFSENAPAVVALTLGASPFTYRASSVGSAIITGGALVGVNLVRGQVTISLIGERIVPLSIGDELQIFYTVAPTVQFLGD